MNQPIAQDRMVPTVSRIVGGVMIELVYDPEKCETALVASRGDGRWSTEREVNASTGEKLVPYSPHNNLIAHRCVLLPSAPENFGSKETLLADIEAFLHRYVDLSPTFECIAAHYILLTWLYDAFAEMPYLRLRGDYGTGKTRGLIAIGSLCYKPFFAAGASTVSPIFHTLDRFGGTLILDEADFRFTDATADLVKVFNNGTVKGLPVLRSVQNRHKEFNPAAFNVFGPKIIAMRGSFEDEALESRFFTEETDGRALRTDVPLHLPESLQEEALHLRNRLLHFRLCTRFTTQLNPGRAMMDLGPRANQIALPLLSLIDDPQVRSDVKAMLYRQQERRTAGRSQTMEAQILKATLDALKNADGTDVPVQAVTEILNRSFASEGGYALSPRRVGSILKSKFRVETRKSHGVFLVSATEKDRLTNCATRYGINAQVEME